MQDLGLCRICKKEPRINGNRCKDCQAAFDKVEDLRRAARKQKYATWREHKRDRGW